MHVYDRLLSEYLRRKRGDQTVRAFARKIGLTHGTLHRIENLQQSITIGKLGIVLERLDTSWEEVFGRAKSSRLLKTTKEKKDGAKPVVKS